MKRESPALRADSPFYTKRFAFYIGWRCTNQTAKDVAKGLHLDWRAIRELEMKCICEKLHRVGMQHPKIIGIDEI